MSYELANNIIYNYSKQISYVPAIAKELKSIEAAIILNRIFFYWKTKSKYFYKFKEPCTHEWYREGDSWTEELSITRKVFDNALKKISTRIKKGSIIEHNKMIEHWTTNNVTYYQINLKNWNSFNQKLEVSKTFKINNSENLINLTEYQKRQIELKTMPYHDYLLTEEWKIKRKYHLKKAKYKCQLCGINIKDAKLEVHHKTYENRGNEKYKDLIVVCNNCHSILHDNKLQGDNKLCKNI